MLHYNNQDSVRFNSYTVRFYKQKCHLTAVSDTFTPYSQ